MPWALGYTWLILKISHQAPNLTIIEQAKAYTPVLGIILGLILVIFFILVAAYYLYDLADFLQTLLPKTPTIVFSLMVIALGAFAIKLGLESLARLAVILIIPVLILIAVGIVPSLFTIDHPTIQMPLDNWKHTVKGTIFQSAVFGELLVLTMLLPLVNKPGSIGKFIFITIFFAWFLIVALVFTLYGNFNIYTSQIIYKLFELYRDVGRIESLFILLWVTTFLIKVSIFFYAAVKGLSDVFGLKSHGPLVWPMAVFIAFFSLVSFENYIDYLRFLIDIYPLVSLSVELGIPVLFGAALLVGAGLKGSRSKA